MHTERLTPGDGAGNTGPSQVRTLIVIPARYGSSRLPGKPLADLLGKPMIQHVYERAAQVPGIAGIVVATDHEKVLEAVERFGGVAMMTSPHHESGTDRLAEVMQQWPADVYINVQGDEPLIRPGDIGALADLMASDTSIPVGTLCHAISAREAANPNCVKVVRDQDNRALYFSRSPIPYARNPEAARYLKHVGVYAYRRDVLARFRELSRPMLEEAELLEQLRLMAAGIAIKVIEVEPTGPGVDTPACQERVRALLAGKPDPMEHDPLAAVRLVITDVDGVLTDGSIWYDETGECIKRFHVRDGLGIRMLEECGIRVAALSGRDSATLRKRVADLGFSASRLGVKDKFEACQAIMADLGVTREQTACIGDDSIDLPMFAACGLSYTVADAASYVKDAVSGVLQHSGGHGAFRELADRILAAQGKLDVATTAQGFAKVMHGAAQ